MLARLLGTSSTPQYQQKKSQERTDPLGITTLYKPEGTRNVDIIFIHGLGGSSLRTWCKNRDTEFLWPKLWLPLEPDLSRARILTYGYNAHFASSKNSSSLTIGDFATDLLYRMKYDDVDSESLGDVPIIIVAHSMGGLVFKRAYIQGSNNEEYRGVISSIKAALFLATPHRGTDLAESLNRILSSSIFGHSSKDYIAELTTGSTTIDELNESFRHHASRLRIFSFYETLSTPVGPRNVMILEKTSSLLGYPNETTQALNANHHDVCKFTHTEDPNYVSVRGALRSVIKEVAPQTTQQTGSSNEYGIQNLQEFLDVDDSSADEAAALRTLRKEGTCEDFLSHEDFVEWTKSPCSCILWANAPPGNGKSIQASAVLDYFLERRSICCHYFFKYSDETSRSLSHCFRSLALQLAQQIPAVRDVLYEQIKLGTQLREVDGLTAWRMIFTQILSTVRMPSDVHWIIDGLDESESSTAFIHHISNVSSFESPIRILIFSRPLPIISQAVQKASKTITVKAHSLQENIKDICLVAQEEMEYLVSDDSFKQATISQIAERSNGSFLWASLVIKQVLRCHRTEDVKKVLDTIPSGMRQLYARMAEAVSSLELDRDIALARLLLECATYSKRPLSVDELRDAYPSELGTVIDLRHTSSQLGGQFITIDSNGQLVLVHYTAREYLHGSKNLPFLLDSAGANEKHFLKCLALLCNRGLPARINQKKHPPFLNYAATSWAFHLDHVSSSSDKALNALLRLFKAPSSLSWIQYLASKNKMIEIVKATTSLADFVRKRREFDSGRPPILHRIPDLEYLESWTVDLLRITAKFGEYLVKEPVLIHKCIPQLCPSSSMIHQKFTSPNDPFSVAGISTVAWDDCLVRLSVSPNRAMHMAVSDDYIAVADDALAGNITIWRRSTFQRHSFFSLPRPISRICVTGSGSMLACFSSRYTYIWRLETGALIAELPNPSAHFARAIDMNFGPKDGSLMIVTDPCTVHMAILGENSSGSWIQLELGPSLLKEVNGGEDVNLYPIPVVALNQDNTQIAVASKESLLSVWNIDPPEMLARLQGRRNYTSTTSNNEFVPRAVSRATWDPSNTFILGIYEHDGIIFKWSPGNDVLEDTRASDVAAKLYHREIACSPNGLVFATVAGQSAPRAVLETVNTVNIYEISSMSLIYKFSSQKHFWRICFSLDSRMLYGLQGSSCNAWQPNCLTRLTDDQLMDDSDSAGGSDRWNDTWSGTDANCTNISFSISEAQADSKPGIKGLACAPALHLVSYWNAAGAIEIYDMNRDTAHVVLKGTDPGWGLYGVVWDPKQKHLAHISWVGRITIREIGLDRTAKIPSQAIKQTVVFNKETACDMFELRQILFNNTGTLLLAAFRGRTQVLQVPEGKIAAEIPSTKSIQTCTWRRHIENDLLLCVSPTNVLVFTWSSLALRREILIDWGPTFTLQSRERDLYMEAVQVLAPAPGKLLLVLHCLSSQIEPQKFLSMLDLASIGSDADSSHTDEAPTPRETTSPISNEPLETSAKIAGFISNGRVVFLDRDLWVCSTELEGGPGSVRRHFFIPRDWTDERGFALCEVLPDGTFLCPCKGKVAVIRSEIASQW